MTYKRFEDLPVWQAAMDLSIRIDRLIRDRAFRRPGDLADQLSRAALSVSNNIAEGFERGTTKELLYFLYIARGSAGEARSMLRKCERESEFQHLKSPISDLTELTISCSRQIRKWADSLQNANIRGQRHLNEHSRIAWNQQQRAQAFRQKLRAMTPHLQALQPPDEEDENN